ncbi:carboxypeptidase regulatory-like domain-containing protein [Knoellia aerolata]|uniref:Carboxypeptidase regulatory-like domain-containing protein n=1 Tax=Knoellia aerolata DSM 18566 TaxID=1385519 RepID=A0A0A0JX15_9MICO|nr:carboxypeptidase regulatory-like domain-containing protein [Knoellia aerolata]KGN40121.1 hypothetical protein N801_14265 [Knoellia aerolata DSM 18566]
MTAPHDEDLLAEKPIDADDERALRLVRAHLDLLDPVPADLAERVKFAMTVASLEAEVAHLMSDALELTAVRTTEYDRATTVTFESGSLSIMVTLEAGERSAITLRGWVTAPGAEVELRERSRSSVTVADDEGRFVFDGVERGTVNLVIRLHDEPGARPVITPGIEL